MVRSKKLEFEDYEEIQMRFLLRAIEERNVKMVSLLIEEGIAMHLRLVRKLFFLYSKFTFESKYSFIIVEG